MYMVHVSIFVLTEHFCERLLTIIMHLTTRLNNSLCLPSVVNLV